MLKPIHIIQYNNIYRREPIVASIYSIYTTICKRKGLPLFVTNIKDKIKSITFRIKYKINKVSNMIDDIDSSIYNKERGRMLHQSCSNTLKVRRGQFAEMFGSGRELLGHFTITGNFCIPDSGFEWCVWKNFFLERRGV